MAKKASEEVHKRTLSLISIFYLYKNGLITIKFAHDNHKRLYFMCLNDLFINPEINIACETGGQSHVSARYLMYRPLKER